MKFSSIPPENLQKLGGIDDFLPDSARILIFYSSNKSSKVSWKAISEA